MRESNTKTLDARARAMRQAMTPPERRLWGHLRKRLGLVDTHFRRQVVIGTSIADFACVTHRLVVEVDGEQHGFDAGRERDDRRTRMLNAEGWRVMRFTNREVMREIDSVLDTIRAAIEGKL